MHVLGSLPLAVADRFLIRHVETFKRADHPTPAVIAANSPVAPVLTPRVEQVHVPRVSKGIVHP